MDEGKAFQYCCLLGSETEDMKVVDEHLLSDIGGLGRQMVKREKSEARSGGRTQI